MASRVRARAAFRPFVVVQICFYGPKVMWVHFRGASVHPDSQSPCYASSVSEVHFLQVLFCLCSRFTLVRSVRGLKCFTSWMHVISVMSSSSGKSSCSSLCRYPCTAVVLRLACPTAPFLWKNLSFPCHLNSLSAAFVSLSVALLLCHGVVDRQSGQHPSSACNSQGSGKTGHTKSNKIYLQNLVRVNVAPPPPV